jgi:hypothetical protein
VEAYIPLIKTQEKLKKTKLSLELAATDNSLLANIDKTSTCHPEWQKEEGEVVSFVC